jgi:DNA-binding PadR family transcriptional regulator
MELVEKVHITRRLGKRERQYYALTEKGRVVLKGSVTTR